MVAVEDSDRVCVLMGSSLKSSLRRSLDFGLKQLLLVAGDRIHIPNLKLFTSICFPSFTNMESITHTHPMST